MYRKVTRLSTSCQEEGSRTLESTCERERGKGLAREQIARAVGEYESGKSIAQIAKLLEFNPAAIWRALKMQGVEMRPKGFQPQGRPGRLQ